MTSVFSTSPEVVDSLALAVVSVSEVPILLLDDQLSIVAASTSFSSAFGMTADDLAARSIFDLEGGQWNVPQLRSLLRTTLSGSSRLDTYEMDLRVAAAPPRRLVLRPRKLAYTASGSARLLLTVTDVTAARASQKLNEDLIREKDVLLQEIQHRVANSLQIIASVLMQSARQVLSEETKTHLVDAHHRVMSVAAVQRQLAASHLGDVEMGPYLRELCDSIGASMISDQKRIFLSVTADESTMSADTSVCLGLLVTELVINALKHAFPEGRHGKIVVDYRSQGPNWALSVNDDGVGIDKVQGAKPSLGTTIIKSLADQLLAKLDFTDLSPGTRVQIAHTQIAIVGEPER